MSTRPPDFESAQQERDRQALDDRAKIEGFLEEKRQIQIKARDSVRTLARDDPYHPAFLSEHDQWFGYKCGKRIVANAVLGVMAGGIANRIFSGMIPINKRAETVLQLHFFAIRKPRAIYSFLEYSLVNNLQVNRYLGAFVGMYLGLDYCGEEASYLSAASKIRKTLQEYKFMQSYLAVNRFDPQTENRGLREGMTGPMSHYVDDRRPT